MEEQGKDKIRLDKWLKITRIFKTRSQAASACEEGKVSVNDHMAKAAKAIKIGDCITVKLKFKKRTFDVAAITHKSVSAEKARLLYREHEPTPEEAEEEAIRKAIFEATSKFRPKFKGRPTKKEGRTLRQIRGH